LLCNGAEKPPGGLIRRSVRMTSIMRMAFAVALMGAAVSVQAREKGDWILRAGATAVDPNTRSDTIHLPTGLEAKARADDDIQSGLIPLNMAEDKWAIEILAATPFDHDLEARGKGAIAGVCLPAGTTKYLPPTVSVQWHPRGCQSGWQPYIGLGVTTSISVTRMWMAS
jgi:outer membrane protein